MSLAAFNAADQIDPVRSNGQSATWAEFSIQ